MKQIKTGILIAVTLIELVYGHNFALAARWERKNIDLNNKNKVDIEGECDGKAKVVTVYLVDKITNEQIYSGGVECKDGKFKFKDDLSKWNIPNGSYNLVVGDGQKERDLGHIEEFEVKDEPALSPITVVASGSNSGPVAENVFSEAMERFADGLQVLSESLKQMKESLEQMNINITIKTAISGILVALEKLVSESQVLFASLQEQFQNLGQESPKSVDFTAISETPGATPTGLSIPSPVATSSQEVTPTPEPLPSPTPSASDGTAEAPASTAEPTMTPEPTPMPVLTPELTPEPTPTPPPEPTPEPSPSLSPVVESIPESIPEPAPTQ